VSYTGGDGWQRLHPLSPLVRGGRATIGIAIILAPAVLTGRGFSNEYPQLGVVGVIVALGFVSWLVTRWRIHEDDLQIETGLLRRRSTRFPLAQLQAIDIVQPGLARLFKVAELRLRMGGASGATARLAYVPQREAEPLRKQLLELARGERGEQAGAETDAEAGVALAPPPENVLATVASPLLAASILLSDVGLFAEALLVGLAVTYFVSSAAATGIVTGGFVWIVSSFTIVWRRFNQEYRLTVAHSSDGLHVRGGLVALTAETIRPGRVQAVRLVEPLLWRALGWCRLEVDVAGRQRGKGEGAAQRRSLRTVLPVGSRALAEELLDVLVPDRPRELSPAPRRARWKSPLRYSWLGWARNETCVVTRSGRLQRVTSWVPLQKAQSFRRVQGPIQRRLALASIHVDTAGKSVHATLRDRSIDEADRALVELTDLARAARRAA
jgi:putative membrane protein